MAKKVTASDFIVKASAVHGNKYDYSLTQFFNALTKVAIICPIHGPFLQIPGNHLSGKGCPKCGVLARGSIRKHTLSDFIKKAISVHGDRFDYSLANYTSAKTKIQISCSSHGVFLQTPDHHLRGAGCPKCRDALRSDALKHSLTDFLEKAVLAHGQEYDYSLVRYSDANTHITIVCKAHGPFRQTPKNHTQGHGCPSCGNVSAWADRRPTTSSFIERATLLHGSIYDYSMARYLDSKTPVTILCPDHGMFNQSPDTHLSGSGCPACGKEGAAAAVRYSQEEFISASEKIHNGKYSYELCTYTSIFSKIKIVCPAHGVFMQSPAVHLRGCGCPICGQGARWTERRPSTEDFIGKAAAIHNSIYDYSQVTYVNAKEPVTILCAVHGGFEQTPNNHLSGRGCPACSIGGPSSPEIELSGFLSSLVETKLSDRTTIAPLEIDCLVPSKKLGVEFNGLYYHSDKFRSEDYHLNKLCLSNAAGYDLVQVFEDEWLGKPHIVKSTLKNKLGLSEVIVHARKTEVRVISHQESFTFLSENHLQGVANAEVRLGLYRCSELVMVATFSNTRKVLGALPENWFELVRLCAKVDTVVVGGFSKLLRHFIKTHAPSGIKTFCDRRYFNGKGYEAVGFVKSHDSKPNYYYVKGGQRYSRYMFQKHKLAEKLPVFDAGLTEKENMSANGYLRIYDCGNAVFTMVLA